MGSRAGHEGTPLFFDISGEIPKASWGYFQADDSSAKGLGCGPDRLQSKSAHDVRIEGAIFSGSMAG